MRATKELMRFPWTVVSSGGGGGGGGGGCGGGKRASIEEVATMMNLT